MSHVVASRYTKAYLPPFCRLQIISLLCCILLSIQADLSISLAKGLASTATSLTITGIVFDDYNQNGIRDAREPGINGVEVNIYNRGNRLLASQNTRTINRADGHYAIRLAAQPGGVRVTFRNFGASSTLPQLVGYQVSNHRAGTTVAFITRPYGTYNVNLGLERPEEYCQNNPDVATNCYIMGDQRTLAPVIVKFAYNSTRKAPYPKRLAGASDVGTTWGLAYRRSSDSLFASAYVKRHAGLAPGGSTGSIYLINKASHPGVGVQHTPFVDLNTVFGPGTTGTNPHDTNNYDLDAGAYDAIGKVGLGGLAISSDEQTLYTVNLADRQLYSIQLGIPPAAPVAGSITRTAIPVPADCPNTDFRPFAVASYRDALYVGAVCSGESTVTPALPTGDVNALQAYILLYTPGSGFASTPIFQFPLNYPRHCATSTLQPTCINTASAQWRPWHPGYIETVQTAYPTYPQPMLTGITFDRGDLILGLRDRYGDQLGFHNLTPDGSRRVSGITAGETLRACMKTPGDLTAGWVLEQNGSCGGITTWGEGSNRGPGGGEYYYQDSFLPYHDHVSLGGVLQVPGFATMMTTTFDAVVVNGGGVRTYNDSTGARESAFEIFNLRTVGEFNKANGLGSLVAFCQAAPIEIGNRIWLDSNRDGIQEPGEPGIAGVTVRLYEVGKRTPVGQTRTDGQGNYYFNASPYKSYIIALDNPADYNAHGRLRHVRLTVANQDSSTHMLDSKAALPNPGKPIRPGNFPQVLVSPHTPGQNDEDLDIGFI